MTLLSLLLFYKFTGLWHLTPNFPLVSEIYFIYISLLKDPIYPFVAIDKSVVYIIKF